MCMKKLPNMKAYWAKNEKIFYCAKIVGLFTRKRFFALLQCLRITDPTTYTMNRNNPTYDKMHQTRGLIIVIREACKREWSMGQFITIDETMVRYKGKYYSARQYMPNKLIKRELKV